jgi:hypothetical protein
VQTGDLYIQHCVDSNDEVAESSESNCSVIGPLTITDNTPSVTLTPLKEIIKKGDSIDLTWSTTGGSEINSCTALGDWSGQKTKLGGTESTGPLTNGRYTYYMRCDLNDGTSVISGQTQVWVLDGTITAESPKDFGMTTTVTWNTQGTLVGYVCEVTDGTDDWIGTSGTETSHPLSAPGQYVLACGEDLSHLVLLDSAQVLVNHTPILTVAPRVVESGGEATVYWTVYEDGCYITGGGEHVNISGTGSHTFTVNARTTYTASCPSTGTASVNVEIQPSSYES